MSFSVRPSPYSLWIAIAAIVLAAVVHSTASPVGTHQPQSWTHQTTGADHAVAKAPV